MWHITVPQWWLAPTVELWTPFLRSVCMFVCPQGRDHACLPTGRNNGTRVLQFQSTDSLLSCTEHSPLVPKWRDRSHNHCRGSASQPWLYCRPLPLLEPWVTDGFLFCNTQPPFSERILLSLALFHTHPLLCMCSLHGNAWYHYGTGGLACCKLLLWIYCTSVAHTKSRQPAKCCQKGWNGLSSNPLSLAEITPLSSDNISLYPPHSAPRG